MKKSVEKTGKNIEECINSALMELGVSREQVEIEILEKEQKGLFGVFGSRPARVLVSYTEQPGDRAKSFVSTILDKMGIIAEVDVVEKGKNIDIDLKGNNMGILIGRRGDTLDALQYLVSLVVNKNSQQYIKVSVDTGNYRSKREETLVGLANKLAEKVVKNRKSVSLEPMNPNERRIIHASLQENKLVNTFSIGEEPNRKVVIALNNGRYRGSKRQSEY